MTTDQEVLEPEQKAEDFPLWLDVEVTIHTQSGPRQVRGIAHSAAPGLAITHHQFGRFDITHVATGMKAFGPFERVSNAMLALAQVSQCADWTGDGASVLQYVKDHGDEPVPFEGCTVTGKEGTRPMTKRELIENSRNWVYLDEFPWEEEHPADQAMAILQRAARRGV